MEKDLATVDQLISWIENQEFTIALEGYNIKEIDNFISYLVSWIKVLDKKNSVLKKQVSGLEKSNEENIKEIELLKFEIQRLKTNLKQMEVNDEHRK
ncbi:hypothetical protein MCANUFG4_02835 [Mycoplasmopsis canis UFG4]|uniref:DivIVA domain-containing protein n=1 Tax=Mycoplasmopsis canis UFG4 TaxID=1131455 RepID=I1A4H3_9BACT|nr:hypothetical protein [Mycoplasmopsis canis]AKF41407.1 hypothetical protein AAW50_03255 [Mycoplasmopsis canis]EIE41242.1 hypothetical protein MCANUFG1_02805 [Mycoplasmopsis canis UFG1]EIE41394.1 hypothetical protein MCANUFG4_02835 [Mycoplasmopsis canis UFG4]